jgi:molybdopterin synthase catalytic subunit
MAVRLQTEDFDPGAEMAALTAGDDGIGAIVTFTGLVRGGAVTAMTLEHYPGMTERALAAIEAEARGRWPLKAALIVHRIGRLLPGERIVFVAAASESRHAAFEAASFLMDYLKTGAPFWKKEETAEGAVWVDARDSDMTAMDRWRA